MRRNSNVPFLASGICADGPVLIAGVTGMVTQRIRPERFFERRSQTSIRRFNQNWANEDSPIRHRSAVMANQQIGIKSMHHFRSDSLIGMIGSAAIRFRSYTKRGQNLDSRSRVTLISQHSLEAVE